LIFRGTNIGKLLEAGKAAPSSGNIQNWKFIVITDKDQRKQLAEFCGTQLWMAKSACAMIVGVADTDKARSFYALRGERLYSTQNCAAGSRKHHPDGAIHWTVGHAWVRAIWKRTRLQ